MAFSIFFQDSAPPGWQQNTAINDHMVVSTWGAGGTTGGHHKPTINFQVPSHQHTTSVDGNHTHDFASNLGPVNSNNPSSVDRLVTILSATDTIAGPHTKSQGAHAHAVNTNDGADNWEPLYARYLTCVKS